MVKVKVKVWFKFQVRPVALHREDLLLWDLLPALRQVLGSGQV